LVQEVMAAMTTEPLRSTWDWPPRVTLASLTLPPTAVPPPPSLSSRATSPAGFSCSASSSSKAAGTPGRGTRSWGRRGPARLGSTSPRSRCRVSENSGSWPGSRHSPWALLYASTRATTSAGRPACQAPIVQCRLIHREEAAGGTVFRRHVGDGGPVSQRQIGQAIAVELDGLADHTALTQHLGHRQHQVGGGHPFAQLAGQLEAHHLGDQHGHRLTEHGCFRLDTANPPAQHTQSVDHGGMGVGADQGVGECPLLAVALSRPDTLGQILEVDLVTDAGARRHYPEVVESVLPPAQEGIALAIAADLHRHVVLEGNLIAEAIHPHRVVDHQVDR